MWGLKPKMETDPDPRSRQNDLVDSVDDFSLSLNVVRKHLNVLDLNWHDLVLLVKTILAEVNK